MSRVFMIGFSLPSGKEEGPIQARNIRGLQFAKALAGNGQEICYVAKPSPGFSPESASDLVSRYLELDFTKPGWLSRMKKAVRDFQPDCCVTTDFYPSYAATFLEWDIPVWMDINGDPLAEKQTSMHAKKTNKGLYSLQSMESRIFKRGDKFSCCSTPQKYALIGKLGIAGRLNRYTFGYPLVHDIPPAAISLPGDQKEEIMHPTLRKLARARDFIVLWAGGYNVWTDTTTLFKGLEMSMDKDSGILYVSTGGPVVDESPYRKFQNLVDQSQHHDRFIFLGWVSRAELLKLFEESDCGVSIDADCYETELGARNRLMEMLANGLPVVTTRGPEITSFLASEGLCRLFSPGDHQGLCDQILALAREKRDGFPLKGKKLAEKAIQKFESWATCKPLIDWCQAPVFSPDRGKIPRTLRIRHHVRGKLRDLKTRYLGCKYHEPDFQKHSSR